jgi:hypothetical protein
MAGAENVLTYIDDLLVHSKNHSDHLVHLANALNRIGKTNLRLNLTKCIFRASDVEYLGHTITSAGIKPGTDKSATMCSLQSHVRSKKYVPSTDSLTTSDSTSSNSPLRQHRSLLSQSKTRIGKGARCHQRH